MASPLRPTLLRQLQSASSKRASPSLVSAFRQQPQPQSLASRPTWTVQRAAFQTSAARRILPPLPQVIKGGVNDPAPVPAPHPSHGSYHWTAERCACYTPHLPATYTNILIRLVSIGLIPMTIMPFAVGSLNPLLDGTLIGLIMLHTYIGFQYAL